MQLKLFFLAESFWKQCAKDDVATLACIPVLFRQLLNYAFFFSGFVALVMLIYGGIRYITSGGDPKQVGAAKQIITYALIGLTIILLSITIVNVIAYVSGARCITTFGFDTCAAKPSP